MANAEGDRVAGRYRLEELIGRGGMGEVWRAHDELLKRTVALKSAHRSDDRASGRLKKEAQHAARPRHQHIVAVFDSFHEGPVRWIVMEYVPAPSLAQRIAERGPRTPKFTAEIGRQLAAALAASHAEGVVHGDVTPANVLVTDDPVAKLTDFGISRARWSTFEGGDLGGVRGTLRYLPPEVAKGRLGEEKSEVFSLGEKSDVFSLGATLYAAVEGHSPYGRTDGVVDLLRRASVGEIEPPQRADRLGPVLTAMLQVEPERRPSAAEAHTMLSGVLAQFSPGDGALHGALTESVDSMTLPLGVRPRRMPSAWPFTTWSWPLRWPHQPGMIAGAALLAVVAIVAAILWPPGQPGTPTPTASPREPVGSTATNAAEMGDVHTADPCGLLDAGTFGRFGYAEKVTDYGELDRCDILLKDEKGDQVADIKLNFASDLAEPDSQSRIRRVGKVSVVELPEDAGSCDRNIRLPDGNQLWITGDEDAPASPDACQLASMATDHAVRILNRGPVPRRPSPFPDDSLARINACDLLDDSALSVVPGVDSTDEEPGFAEWDCAWSSGTSQDSVEIGFNRDNDLTEDGKPTRLGGVESYVAPEYDDQDDTCVVMTVNRTYTNTEGDQTVEYVQLTTYGPHPTDQLCDTAEALATAVAKKLPTRR